MKIKHLPLLALLLTFGFHFTNAQNDCSGDRYKAPIFTEVTKTADVEYGQSKNESGVLQKNYVDIFEPVGDEEPLRPLILFAHGGSFIGGERTQGEVVQFCQAFAKRGFVTGSISYRLSSPASLFLGGAKAAMEAAVRGTFDGKAAVRFFRKSVVEEGNPYRIDTNRIYFGGSSAGAFIALHLAYLHTVAEFEQYSGADAAFIDNEGGLDGNGGSPGYWSQVHGVINLCGALGKASWLNAGEPPLISLHGTNDGTVPYKDGIAASIAPVEGSFLIDQRAQAEGVESHLYTYYGADHVPYATGGSSAAKYADTTTNYIQTYIYNWVCKTGTSVEPVKNKLGLTLAPNPAANFVNLTFEAPLNAEVVVYNTMGQVVLKSWIKETQSQISTAELSNGLYTLKVTANGVSASQKLMIQK